MGAKFLIGAISGVVGYCFGKRYNTLNSYKVYISKKGKHEES